MVHRIMFGAGRPGRIVSITYADLLEVLRARVFNGRSEGVR